MKNDAFYFILKAFFVLISFFLFHPKSFESYKCVHWNWNTIFTRWILWELVKTVLQYSPVDILSKGCSKLCSKFTGEHPCWSLISICHKVKLHHKFCRVDLLHNSRAFFYLYQRYVSHLKTMHFYFADTRSW